MALSENFPKDPFVILDPSERWFPADESLRETSAEKLLPPLVSEIRKKVDAFRKSGYEGASATSKSLLKWWFQTEHFIEGSTSGETFNYYFAQREAIESLIYLHDVGKLENQAQLTQYDAQDLLSVQHFEETWRRYVLKLATGAGKTKVLSLALVWSYFHKLYEADSDMATNFLLIAPNIIVLERLRVDFDGLKIFREDPLIPENGFQGKDWEEDFHLDLHIQDQVQLNSKTGNIFLTNIQRVYEKNEQIPTASDDDSTDYFLGERQNLSTTQSDVDLRDVIGEVEEIVVMNDEAHHIHDSSLAWYKAIETLHLHMLQKDSKVSMQIDVTATPKHQRTGAIFVQTICDYPLVEAIAQNVVKTPVLPDIASRSKLSEKTSSKFSEKYADYLRLGVEEWKKAFEEHKKTGKKAVLFVMTDDTKNCDEVSEWLEEQFPEYLQGKVLTIHTKNNGEISEAQTGRNKEELDLLRKQSREIDSLDSPYRAIVSVLMLKEGWDVRNVTTIVGLRPFTAEANILPEQALGRGLRRMYMRDAGIQEYVSVIGTPAFMDFVESIKSEGVVLEYKPMNKDSGPIAPKVVEIDQDNKKKDLDKLDIEIPILTPRFKKEYKRLEELDLDKLEFEPIEYKSYSDEQLREIVFEDITDGEEHHRTVLTNDGPSDWRFVVSFLTQRILKDLRLFRGYDTLYPKVKNFCESHLFSKTVVLDDDQTIKNLSEVIARRTVEETFKKAINDLTVYETGETEIKDSVNLRKTRPFTINDSEYYQPKKSVFNIISGDSRLELDFSAYLDRCEDVLSFGKNFFAVNFKLDYQNADGNISYYYPDFLVKLTPLSNKEELFVVETKGREDLDVPLKMKRLKQWCKDVNEMPNAKQIWNFLYVPQDDFESYVDSLKSFRELVQICKEYQ
ncbi:MAG: DEAD/DEAH box helicase family protein [Actinomycetota bacterium]|nr:DEAD/DEAH box helicase family protein [Actinomycetota bacterium]